MFKILFRIRLQSKEILFLMTAKIIDGRKISQKVCYQIANQVTNYTSLGARAPGLAVILVGKDPASQIYVNSKKRVCKEIGFILKFYEFNLQVSEHQLLKLIKDLNKDSTIDGILVQLPLPKGIDENSILRAIIPNKDVDGFHPYNIGRLCQQDPYLRPCAASGVVTILNYYKINTQGLYAVIIGDSNHVGRPIGLELLQARCTTTITHCFTKNLSYHVNHADLLVVAIGKPQFIPGSWIKRGAVVIDIGINRLNNGKVVGDVFFNTAIEHASYITPVPGGVGPVTVASLMQNTLQAYMLSISI